MRQLLHLLFYPPTVEINTGESVTWTNPTKVAEPHQLRFFLDNTSMAGIVSPLAVSNTTKFMTIPPGSNNEPILLPSDNIIGMSTMITVTQEHTIQLRLTPKALEVYESQLELFHEKLREIC